MLIFLATLLATLSSILRSRATLELENLAPRHQIGVRQRSARKRPKLLLLDRLLWAWLSRVWSDWRSALPIVQPDEMFRQQEAKRVGIGFEIPSIVRTVRKFEEREAA